MLLNVLLDGALGDEEPLGDRSVRAAFGHQREHLPLALCQVVDRVVSLPALSDELRNDGRVEHRPALTDAPHGTAVDQLLRTRWAALQRTEARLAAGSYGRSVASGRPIPDERLEANPLAEPTVQEAAAAERSTLEEPDDAAGLVSARHLFEVLSEADITPGSLVALNAAAGGIQTARIRRP
jgi:RNA polymerase-binding transcription factor DksA